MLADRFIGRVLRESTTINCLQSDIHGVDHWYRVWQNAQILASATSNVDEEIVALFALFHDAMRDNDNDDPHHGLRGWNLWLSMKKHQLLTVKQTRMLFVACTSHSLGHVTYEPTIGVCWDADRLDLPRVGIRPHPSKMSTDTGKGAASAMLTNGSV